MATTAIADIKTFYEHQKVQALSIESLHPSNEMTVFNNHPMEKPKLRVMLTTYFKNVVDNEDDYHFFTSGNRRYVPNTNGVISVYENTLADMEHYTRHPGSFDLERHPLEDRKEFALSAFCAAFYNKRCFGRIVEQLSVCDCLRLFTALPLSMKRVFMHSYAKHIKYTQCRHLLALACKQTENLTNHLQLTRYINLMQQTLGYYHVSYNSTSVVSSQGGLVKTTQTHCPEILRALRGYRNSLENGRYWDAKGQRPVQYKVKEKGYYGAPNDYDEDTMLAYCTKGKCDICLGCLRLYWELYENDKNYVYLRDN